MGSWQDWLHFSSYPVSGMNCSSESDTRLRAPFSGSWEVSTVMQPGVSRASVVRVTPCSLGSQQGHAKARFTGPRTGRERPGEVSGSCQPPKPIRRSAVNYLSGSSACHYMNKLANTSLPPLVPASTVSLHTCELNKTYYFMSLRSWDCFTCSTIATINIICNIMGINIYIKKYYHKKYLK